MLFLHLAAGVVCLRRQGGEADLSHLFPFVQEAGGRGGSPHRPGRGRLAVDHPQQPAHLHHVAHEMPKEVAGVLEVTRQRSLGEGTGEGEVHQVGGKRNQQAGRTVSRSPRLMTPLLVFLHDPVAELVEEAHIFRLVEPVVEDEQPGYGLAASRWAHEEPQRVQVWAVAGEVHLVVSLAVDAVYRRRGKAQEVVADVTVTASSRLHDHVPIKAPSRKLAELPRGFQASPPFRRMQVQRLVALERIDQRDVNPPGRD